MSNIILTSDGTVDNTIISADGVQLRGIIKVEFEPIIAGGLVRATFTVEGVRLQLDLPSENVETKDAS